MADNPPEALGQMPQHIKREIEQVALDPFQGEAEKKIEGIAERHGLEKCILKLHAKNTRLTVERRAAGNRR